MWAVLTQTLDHAGLIQYFLKPVCRLARLTQYQVPQGVMTVVDLKIITRPDQTIGKPQPLVQVLQCPLHFAAHQELTRKQVTQGPLAACSGVDKDALQNMCRLWLQPPTGNQLHQGRDKTTLTVGRMVFLTSLGLLHQAAGLGP